MDNKLAAAIKSGLFLKAQDLKKKNSYSDKEGSRAKKWIERNFFTLVQTTTRKGYNQITIFNSDIIFLFNRIKFSALVGELKKIEGLDIQERDSSYSKNKRYILVYWKDNE